jgi:hypothetical protein
MEHRWGTRIDLNTAGAVVAPDGREETCMVRNASVSGAFLETELRVPVLSRVYVRPAQRPGQKLEGCVVRADKNGLGVEWLQPGVRPVSSLLPRFLPDGAVAHENLRHAPAQGVQAGFAAVES